MCLQILKKNKVTIAMKADSYSVVVHISQQEVLSNTDDAPVNLGHLVAVSMLRPQFINWLSKTLPEKCS